MEEKKPKQPGPRKWPLPQLACLYMVASWGPGLAVRKEAAFAQLRRELSRVRSRRGLRAAKRAANSPQGAEGYLRLNFICLLGHDWTFLMMFIG